MLKIKKRKNYFFFNNFDESLSVIRPMRAEIALKNICASSNLIIKTNLFDNKVTFFSSSLLLNLITKRLLFFNYFILLEVRQMVVSIMIDLTHCVLTPVLLVYYSGTQTNTQMLNNYSWFPFKPVTCCRIFPSVYVAAGSSYSEGVTQKHHWHGWLPHWHGWLPH